jgi:septal ring factor EnvC (AmiA/AmiB activator)
MIGHTGEIQHEIGTLPERGERVRQREKAKRGTGTRWLAWSAAILIWGGLAYGCYLAADHYITGIRQELQDIRQTNESRLDALKGDVAALHGQLEQQRESAGQLLERLAALEEGLAGVQEELSLAGDALGQTDETRQALSNRITDLSKQLQDLQNAIRKLEEAARVY